MSDVALRFGAKDVGLNAHFRKINEQLDTLQGNARDVAGGISKTFNVVAGLAAVVGLGKLVGQSLEFADAQKKMAATTDLSTDATQRLSFIAGEASVEVGTLTSGINKLQRVLGGLEEGSESSAAAIERLGLANSQFANLDPERKFLEVAKSIAGIADANERAVRTNEIFGKSGAELLPVLNAIGKEGNEIEARLDAIGGPVGAKAIDQVDQLGDTFATTGLAAKSLTTELLAMIAPPVIFGLETVQKILGGIRILATGGNDESLRIDSRIKGLQHELDLQQRLLYPNEQRVKLLKEEIAQLRQKYDLIHGLGQAGSVTRIPFTVADPLAGGGPAFEETDDQRKERLESESEARLQRLQHIATMYEIERAMAFEHNESLIKIDEARIDKIVAKETEAVMKRLQVQTDAQRFLADVRQVFGLREIKFEEIKNQSIIEIARDMFTTLARENSKLAKIQQGIALAQTIWSTATGIMRAFETLPWPANLVAAAKVAITGAIQVAKIRSTNYSAGSVSGTAPTLGGGSSIGTARDTSPQDAPEVAREGGATQVFINGFISHDVIDYLAESLRAGFDRDVVIIPQNSLQAEIIRGSA